MPKEVKTRRNTNPLSIIIQKFKESRRRKKLLVEIQATIKTYMFGVKYSMVYYIQECVGDKYNYHGK